MVLKIEASTGREAGSRWHLRLLRSPPQWLPDKCLGGRHVDAARPENARKTKTAFLLGKEGLCSLCRVKEFSQNMFLGKDLEKMAGTGYKLHHCLPDPLRGLQGLPNQWFSTVFLEKVPSRL